MNKDDLRNIQAHFEKRRQDRQNDYKKLEKLQKEFIKRFPIDKVKNLSLEDYVEGKIINGEVDRRTFCYCVEWETEELGRMQGATSKKFGIYMDTKTQRYIPPARFSSDDEAFLWIRNQIVKLIELGDTANLDELENIELSPMFKGKILFLYYPNKFLNIFSGEYVEFYLHRIGMNSSLENLVHKRAAIVKWKNQDDVMKSWSMYEFSDFLKNELGRPPKESSTPPELKPYLEFYDIYPTPEDTEPSFIELPIIPSKRTEGIHTKKDPVTNIKNQIDYERQNRTQRQLGELGEQIVLRIEKSYLVLKKRSDLADKVKQISSYSPHAGYDVLSYELDGTEKHIEVKTTASPPSSEVTFFLTANEYQQSMDLSNYYLYIVFNAKRKKPMIWPIKNPAKYEESGLYRDPILFRCSITTAYGGVKQS